MTSTKLLYLDDTYQTTSDATFLSEGTDEKGRYIVVDQTVFYPQGGGQPTDKGTIHFGENDVPVHFVGYVEGEVRHYIPTDADFNGQEGRPVVLDIDAMRRMNHARLHTGGHLVSLIVENIIPDVKAIKGYHFPEGPHVEFNNAARADIASHIDEINRQLAEALILNSHVQANYSNFQEVEKLAPHLAAYVPNDKPIRIVQIGSIEAQPCGGTHVASLSELGSVQVTKCKNKKDRTKISYTVTPISPEI